ncbi:MULTISPECIES: polymorphic toxin type 10 domain-containing protein [unclassified Pseudomonas]|uniref:polymorphic toxin type 10 domain-containing protein n=1 Tax=unclassified Pseudomonas TaxID=196821 RepID=UPI0034DD697B
MPSGLNPTNFAKPGDLDAFVTNASELRGLSNAQIAERLTIPEIPGGFRVIEFPSSSVDGIASPVFRTNPGFVQGGKTAGGAAEFVIPNGPIPSGATQWFPQ